MLRGGELVTPRFGTARVHNHTMSSTKVEVLTEGAKYLRIPQAGRDPVFGLTRSWFYNAEAAGLLRFRRVRMPGRTRGVVLVPVADVEALIEKAKA